MASTTQYPFTEAEEQSSENRPFTPSAHPGILHHYTPTLTAFEHHHADDASLTKPHSLLFIAGLSDGFLTVPFLQTIVAALSATPWSVFSVLLSSSYSGWGTSNLAQDCAEIGQCIQYVRSYKRSLLRRSKDASSFSSNDNSEGDGDGDGTGDPKIVLMGHSTGSQDTLHYLIYHLKGIDHSNDATGPSLSLSSITKSLDGAILQAPVSDREGLAMMLSTANDATKAKHEAATTLAMNSIRQQQAERLGDEKEEVEKEEKDTPAILLPLSLTRPFYGPDTPLTAERWLSLTAKRYSPPLYVDDLFSSDVTDDQLDKTFGAIQAAVKFCVLYSGNDEHVPDWVDKAKLLERWKLATRRGQAVWDEEFGGIVKEARHAMHGERQEGARREVAERVKGFLGKV